MLLPRALLVCTVSLAMATSGCGAQTGAGPREGSSDLRPVVAPPLTSAEPLADPRSWRGEVVTAADVRLQPVSPGEPRLPVTVTDSQGSDVRITDVSRVLALDVHGTLARTVFELGMGDRLVGRDVSTAFSEAENLPVVTQNGHELNAEAILELDPTMIITDTSLGPWDVVLQMRDAGVPVVVLEPERGLGNVDDLTEQVGAALGVPGAGRALGARIRSQVDRAVDDIARLAPRDPVDRLRTVFLYARGQSGVYYMFGKGSGADSLIEAIGAYDVAEEIGWDGMKPLTDEGLVAAQPELVLMMTKGLESAGGVDGLLERFPALAETPAGQNRRFVAMADSQILGYGPGTAAVLNALAVAVHAPEALT